MNISNRKTKICHLIPSFGVGGAERLISDLLPRLLSTDFEVSLVCLASAGIWRDSLASSGVIVYELNRPGRWDLRFLLELRRLLRELSPDILHTHLWGADFWGFITTVSLRGIKIVSTEHNVNKDEAWWRKILKSFVFRHFDRVIAVSPAVADDLSRQGLSPNQILVIPNGVDLDCWPLRPPRVGPGFVIGAAGRLVPQKGIKVLIEALALVKDQNVTCRIAGDGPLREELQALVEQLGLGGRVSWLGNVNNMSDFYASLDLFILPSLWEGFGLVMLEAALSGRPVVASAVDGVHEIITDRKSGLLVEPDNAVALAAAIDCLQNDADLSRRLADSLRTQTISDYSLLTMSARYLELYRSLVKI